MFIARVLVTFAISSLCFAACSGGGGSSPTQPTTVSAVTPSPVATATPVATAAPVTPAPNASPGAYATTAAMLAMTGTTVALGPTNRSLTGSIAFPPLSVGSGAPVTVEIGSVLPTFANGTLSAPPGATQILVCLSFVAAQPFVVNSNDSRGGQYDLKYDVGDPSNNGTYKSSIYDGGWSVATTATLAAGKGETPNGTIWQNVSANAFEALCLYQ